jgi:hypothetical protein
MKFGTAAEELHELIISFVGFSAFYGAILINWVDLFVSNPNPTTAFVPGCSANPIQSPPNPIPYYHIWLVMMYFAPFVVVLLIKGVEDWQFTLALGLFTSLMNDVLYFWVGDVLFGLNVSLPCWLAGQFGLKDSLVLFTFVGGPFTFPVYSWMMLLAIVGRALIVVWLLNRWWNSPARGRGAPSKYSLGKSAGAPGNSS